MRAAARCGAGAGAREADLAPQHLSPQNLRLLPPDPRGARLLALVARHAKRAATSAFIRACTSCELFSRGYIASHSRHSAGTAVDLTLVALPPRQVAPFDRAPPFAPCTAPAAQRAPDNSLDMGTGFDCLDVKSYTPSAAVTPAQRRARRSKPP